MKLPKFVVSITDHHSVDKTHIVEFYNAESPAIAAYIVAVNNLDIDFEDIIPPHEQSLEDAVFIFYARGYSLIVLSV